MLVSYLLPVGLRGLVLAGMLVGADELAGLAVQLDGDAVHRRLLQAPAAAVERAHLVNVGRVATAAWSVLGMAWIPFLQDLGGGQLYAYLQLVQSLLAPSIAAVFMLGIFSRRRHADVGPGRHLGRLRRSA